MIDFTKYRKQDLLQMLKGNDVYKVAIAESEKWEQVVNAINSLNVKYTEEQLEYVKEKQWNIIDNKNKF